MIMLLHKQLVIFLLVVAVLLVPLNSVARYVASGSAQGTCACRIVTIDCSAEDPGELPDHQPGTATGDCCDSEEGCHEATEPPAACDASANISEKQLFHSDPDRYIPTVYLAIFVPPER